MWVRFYSHSLPLQPIRQRWIRWRSSGPDSGRAGTTWVQNTIFLLSQFLGVAISVSRCLVSFVWTQNTLPQQIQICTKPPQQPSCNHRNTPDWAVPTGFWQLNYGWNACCVLSLSLYCWCWTGNLTQTKFRLVLKLKNSIQLNFVCIFWLSEDFRCIFFLLSLFRIIIFLISS